MNTTRLDLEKIYVNGIELAYKVSGKGDPIILLHGNGASHKTLRNLGEKLAKDYTVYAIDSRGHGSSEHVDELHYHDMKEDVIAFISFMGLHKPIIYGHSDGGIIGLLIAMEQPQLLSALIISGASLNARSVLNKVYYSLKVASIFSNSPKIRMMLEEPDIKKSELNSIVISVFITVGEHDIIKKQHTREIVNGIKNHTFKQYKKKEHTDYVKKCDELHRDILAFLGKHRLE